MEQAMIPRVKICGTTSLEDALMAAEAGADLLGFIFYPKSPRYVTPEQVQEIVQALRDRLSDRCPLLVGVFVDEPPERVRAVLDDCGLDLAQLHGSEPPAEVARLADRAYKAIRPKNRAEAEAAIAAYAGALVVRPDRPSFLVDAYHPWKLGGTGQVAPWPAIYAVARRYPLLLAGGLTPENVADAVRTVQPWGVDVASGVEAGPGRKDPQKVRRFIEAAHIPIEED